MVFRGAVVTVAVTVTAACGQGTEPEAVVEDATLGPLVEEPGAESADATTAATTTAEDEVPASGGDGDVTEPSRAGDVVATPELLVRCSDVSQTRTDVLSDTPHANPDPIVMSVFESYADEHADTFGGLWIDPEASGTVVLTFTDDPAPHRAALAQRRPSLDDLPPVILPRRPGDPWPPVSVEPTVEITDDRPIGERGVAFDVVQVSHTQVELIGAIAPVLEAAQTITAAVGEAGVYPFWNRVGIHLPTPVSETELVAIADAIDDLEGVSLDMVCWSGQLVDEVADSATVDSGVATVTYDDLNGRQFIAQAIEGLELVPGSQVRLRFDGRWLFIAGGCNGMSASYVLDGDMLTTGEWAIEEASCEDEAGRRHPTMAQDQRIAGLFLRGEPLPVTLDDGKLVFETRSGTATFLDSSSTEPDDTAAFPAIGRADPVGGVDGPVMYGADPGTLESAVMDAALGGRVHVDGDCLHLIDEGGVQAPVLWPYGTRWRLDPPAVILPSGGVVPIGSQIETGGGGSPPDIHTESTEVLERVRQCTSGEQPTVIVVQHDVDVME